MADRTDIDALLISALYGELTPADEARLTAHLESHPADRTALADLTRTRDAIRESRVFAGQLEPPQSVSARLLQEAARLSPRPSARETEGWFFRLTRAFMAHPALAVAAMLVLTVSVAGTLYVRHGGDHLAEMTRPSAPAVQATFVPAAPPAAPIAEPAAPRATPAAEGQGSGSYRVALDEASKEGATERQQAASPGETNKVYKDTLGNESDGFAQTKSLKPMRKSPSKSGIEVRSREPAPKDFDDSEVARGEINDKKRDVTDRVAASGASAPSAVVATPPAVTSGRSVADNAPAQPPAKPSALASADPARGNDGANNQSLVAWVRKQHDLVVSLVKSSNCRDAANAALEIYSRAPAYYDANVTTDRAVKPCLAYLNNERDREQRKVAAKRAMSNDALRAAPDDVQAAPPATKK
jgi:anti-sigma factor RsiW